MQMFDAEHEPGTKTLLNGTVVAAGQTGLQDVDAAIDNLFNHPNVGPFIGRQLIQRLVTSNPSPAYVERVARAFNGDATGVRGDMRAVLRAVLLDPEANAAPGSSPEFGKLREPVVRYAPCCVSLAPPAVTGLLRIPVTSSRSWASSIRCRPRACSISTLPAHSPAGEIASANLVAPEFQITTSNSIVGLSNLIDFIVLADFVTDAPEPFAPVSLTYDDYVAIGGDIDALVDRLDICPDRRYARPADPAGDGGRTQRHRRHQYPRANRTVPVPGVP